MKYLAGLLLLISAIAPAQQVSAYVAHGWSENAELNRPIGFGAMVGMHVAAGVELGLSFERLSYERTYDGYSSSGFGAMPVWESIRSSSRTSVLKLGLSYFPFTYENISAGIAAGVSSVGIDITKRGLETNSPVGTKGGQKFGAVFSLLVRLRPPSTLPLALDLSAHQHYLGKSTSYSTDVENPVHDDLVLTSVTIGITYFF